MEFWDIEVSRVESESGHITSCTSCTICTSCTSSRFLSGVKIFYISIFQNDELLYSLHKSF